MMFFELDSVGVGCAQNPIHHTADCKVDSVEAGCEENSFFPTGVDTDVSEGDVVNGQIQHESGGNSVNDQSHDLMEVSQTRPTKAEDCPVDTDITDGELAGDSKSGFFADDVSTTVGIRQLPACVVRRIAAGEVISRPANALKELLENALDACALNISIVCQGGGLQLLSVADDGCGVSTGDLHLLCARHCTSKLRTVEDLRSINTFGFRGEALAALAVVAKVQVITRCMDTPHGMGCTYTATGELSGPPHPRARERGTTLSAKDMFYELPTRRKALEASSEEYLKCVELLSKFAIQNPHVGFKLRKHQTSHTDICCSGAGSSMIEEIKEQDRENRLRQRSGYCNGQNTKISQEYDEYLSKDGLVLLRARVRCSGGTLRAVERLYGSAVASSLVPIHLRRDLPSSALKGEQFGVDAPFSQPDGAKEKADDVGGGEFIRTEGSEPNRSKLLKDVSFHLNHGPRDFRVYGLVSNAQKGHSRGYFILFVNERLVEDNHLKRLINGVYSSLLPKDKRPWVYMTITIPPSLVDVNIHPSKAQVQFLYSEFIYSTIIDHLRAVLTEQAGSRDFPLHLTKGARRGINKTEFSSQEQGCQGGANGHSPNITPDNQNEGEETNFSKIVEEQVIKDSGPNRKTTLKPTRTRTDVRQPLLSSFWQMTTKSISLMNKENQPCNSGISSNGEFLESASTDYRITINQLEEKCKDKQYLRENMEKKVGDFVQEGSHTSDACDQLPNVSGFSNGGDRIEMPKYVSQCSWRQDLRLYSESVRSMVGHPLERVIRRNRTCDAWDLLSVQTLIQRCISLGGSGKRDIGECLQEAVYVGAIDKTYAVMQLGQVLLLVNFFKVVGECIYQSILHRIGRLPLVKLNPPVDVRRMLTAAFKEANTVIRSYQYMSNAKDKPTTESGCRTIGRPAVQERSRGNEEFLGAIKESTEDQDAIQDDIQSLYGQLFAVRALLADYFSLVIDGDGKLTTVPLCCGFYIPHPILQRQMLLRLAKEANFTDEEECINDISRILAETYASVHEDEECAIAQYKPSGTVKELDGIDSQAVRNTRICEESRNKELVETNEQTFGDLSGEGADVQVLKFEDKTAQQNTRKSNEVCLSILCQRQQLQNANTPKGKTKRSASGDVVKMAAGEEVRCVFESFFSPALRLYWRCRIPHRLVLTQSLNH